MKTQLTVILESKGTIVKDFENVNGRFVTLAVADPDNIVVGQTVIAAGGIISYMAIYYNKTR